MKSDLLNRTKKLFANKEVQIFGSLYFFLSLINLRVKLMLTPAWFDGTLARNHQLLMQFQYFNKEQSRLLQYLIPEWLSGLFSISVPDAYILQRFIFIFLTFICFHLYLRKWFDQTRSFAGVLFLASILPLTYFNHLQESAPLLLLTFLLGLWAIRESKTLAILVIFIIGGLNNETMLILPLAYLFYNYRTSKLKDLGILLRDTFLISLPLLLTVGPIQYLTHNHPQLGGTFWQFSNNLEGILRELIYILTSLRFIDLYRTAYLFIFLLFNLFWIYAFLDFRNKPLFLKRASLIIPFFILAHLTFGVISEVRQMLPLSFILIPMAFFYILPEGSEGTLCE